VATTQILPVYIRISRKILGKSERSHRVGSMKLVEGLDRMWLSLRCPVHAWSWPRANCEDRLPGYDSHQTCHKCISHRMFDTNGWQAGPVYRKAGIRD
jgi:hypothetical protein